MKREFALVGGVTNGVMCDGDTVHFQIAMSIEAKWIEVFLNDELINVLPISPPIFACCGDILKAKLPPDGQMWLNAWKGNPDVA